MPDDQEGGRESVEAENTRFQEPTFTNDLVHDYPKLDPAHDQVEEERNLFLEIPVVNQDRETVKEGHKLFDPINAGYELFDPMDMAHEESVDDRHKTMSDWPTKEHSLNDINYDDPYDLAKV